MGIVLMFIGFTGQAFQSKDVKELNKGDSFKIGRYDLRMVDLEHGENDNYQFDRATLDVLSKGEDLGLLRPEKRMYKASRQPTSQVALRIRPNEDLYLNFAGMSDDNQRAVIQAYVNPLVSWVWVGGLVLIGGTLICLVPAKIKMQYARTQVVGIMSKHATVQK
jgi:cytochrome c-type biogenesis protein CcmF